MCNCTLTHLIRHAPKLKIKLKIFELKLAKIELKIFELKIKSKIKLKLAKIIDLIVNYLEYN